MLGTIARRVLASVAGVVLCSAGASCASTVAEEDVAMTESTLLGGTTVAFQNGVAPTSGYAGAADTYLAQQSPTRNEGAASTVRVDGDDPGGSNADLVGLLRWDVTAIGAGANVRSASLTLNVTNASGGTFALYEAKKSWNEGQATWNAASNGVSWEAAGASGTRDRGTTSLGSITARATGSYTVTLNASGVAVLQRWIDTPASNAGLVVVGTSSDGLAWSSREATASLRPRLAVGYDSAVVADGGTTTTDSAAPAPVTTTPGVSGTSYYVDAISGSDTAAGTSPSTPWRSLAKASAAPLAPGDGLFLRRGAAWTGTLTLGRSGTASAPIRVSAYGSGALPVVKQGSSCVRLSGSYVVVDQLQAEDCGWAGFEISGTHDVIRDSVATHNVTGVDIKQTGTDNKVTNNQIVDNTKMSVLTVGGDDDSGAFGLSLHGDRNEIAYNRISGHDTFSYDYGRDGSAIEIYGGQNNHIHHNVAEQNDAFTELGHSRSANNTFAYNVVRSSLASSIFLVTRGAASSFGPVLGTRAYNNTVLLTGSSSQGFVCHAGCSASILTMRNNVIQAVAKVGYADAPFDEDYGLYFGGPLQFTRGARSIVADPRFTSPGAGDLHLLSTSPAIDSGLGGLGYATDLDGRAVPLDGNGDGTLVVDRGAYER